MEPIPLAVERSDEAVTMLAHAFEHDTFIEYVFPDPHARTRYVPDLFRWFLEGGLASGEVYAVGEPLYGLAIWMPPREVGSSGDTVALSDPFAFANSWPSQARARITHLLVAGDALETRVMQDAHWSLSCIAVDPAHQRHGLGSTLIETRASAFDRTHMPCFLETTEERYVAFYEQHQFRLLEVSAIPGSDCRIWAMRRN